MDSTRLLVVALAALAFLGAVGGAAYVELTGPDRLPHAAPDDPPGDPAVTGFLASGASCVDAPGLDGATELRGEGATTLVTVTRNVTVPDTAHAATATVERANATTYLLDVASVAVEGRRARGCAGAAEPQVRYTAHLRVPNESRAAFAVVVRHDGRVVSVLRNGERGAGDRWS